MSKGSHTSRLWGGVYFSPPNVRVHFLEAAAVDPSRENNYSFNDANVDSRALLMAYYQKQRLEKIACIHMLCSRVAIHTTISPR